MKIAEAWRLSRIPYKEVVYRSLAEEKGRMWWGAFGRSQPGGEGPGDLELTERALRIAKFDKVIVAAFNIIVAAIPFAPYFLGTGDFGLASSIALSLIVTFGFTTLYAIQTLSSFVGAESTALLSALPIAQGDFSLMTLFSFIRSVDYMVIGSVLCQVAAVALLTGSAYATLIMLAASAINALFAVAAALWFSRVFQTTIMRGGRSKATTALRVVFILMWGFLLVGVGLMFTLPWYLVGNLDVTLLGLNSLSLPLSCLYPFSAGIVIADLLGSHVASAVASAASFALLLYLLFAALAGRWSLGTVRNISRGVGVKVSRVAAKDFSIRPHSQLLGYVLKDLKISSRNPATAFFFALPLLEALIITMLVSNAGMMRTAAVLTATAMGATFALISPLALLSAEGKGLEYTKTLPISSRRIVLSKALISSATFAFVPMVIAGISLLRPLTSATAILIPLLSVLAVASASIFEIVMFLRTTSKGQVSAIANDVQKLSIGVVVVLAPMVAYALAYLLFPDRIVPPLSMAIAVLTELAIAIRVLNRC